MNIERLKEAEKRFFMRYPGGFAHRQLQEIIKKHKPEKMHAMALESFEKSRFEDPYAITQAMSKIVSASSMVSVFEKPKFRELVKSLSGGEKEQLSRGLMEFLHGFQEMGFMMMRDILGAYKLAKWTLITVCPEYYNPSEEIFIKPTTVKGVIGYFELTGLQYSPKPTYAFYTAYRKEINAMKQHVDESLRADNAAFCGFLLMALKEAAYLE